LSTCFWFGHLGIAMTLTSALFLLASSAAMLAAVTEARVAVADVPVAGVAGEDLGSRSAVDVGVRRALILCGHPGTDEYRKTYRRSIEQIYGALTRQWKFSAERVWIRCGTELDASNDRSRGPATRAAIAADVEQLKKTLGPSDALWVFVIGHSHFDGRNVYLNLPGPDMNQSDFGKLFKNVRCRQQVFFITVPASGFFIRDLSAPGRVVITATEADAETNEARFHTHLAALLHAPPAKLTFDRDKDGRMTLLDLYLLVVRRVMSDYHDGNLIPTEHALLDDNGDGRGTELQLDDLEPELGGRPLRRPLQVVTRVPNDGALAASILLGSNASSSEPARAPQPNSEQEKE